METVKMQGPYYSLRCNTAARVGTLALDGGVEIQLIWGSFWHQPPSPVVWTSWLQGRWFELPSSSITKNTQPACTSGYLLHHIADPVAQSLHRSTLWSLRRLELWVGRRGRGKIGNCSRTQFMIFLDPPQTALHCRPLSCLLTAHLLIYEAKDTFSTGGLRTQAKISKLTRAKYRVIKQKCPITIFCLNLF